MAQVKTYRVLRDGLRVGDSIRNFGDFIPEAAGFGNLRSYLNAEILEEIWVEEEVLEEWKNRESVSEESEEEELEEEIEDISGSSESEKNEPEEANIKSVKRKRTVKKKKGTEDNGEEQPVLEEQRV